MMKLTSLTLRTSAPVSLLLLALISGGSACDLWSGRGTWPVGQKGSNELGLYDMSGNVLEWCWDRWSDTSSRRHIRGGSWYYSAGGCTVSLRDYVIQVHRGFDYGFRLARSSGN